MCRLFFITKNDKKSLREASSITCEEICNIWEIANIPTRAKLHVITEIEKLYEQYRSLQKSTSKTTDFQNAKKLMFKECLQDLFDIAHVNAMEMIKYSEDKEFLVAQREKGRRGYIASVDKKLQAKEDRKRKRVERHEMLKNAEIQRCESASEPPQITSSSSSEKKSEDSDEFQIPVDPSEPSTSKGVKSKKPKKIITSEMVMALDRSMTTDRNAVMIISSTAKSLGLDIDNLVISRSSLQRERTFLRKKYQTR